ncbi:hypothetical protein DF947_18500 [Pedobacter paludis]|uniref:Response regulatory domain-containing protein n=2 Tax=Pedobacter paludis TaxID=2203212 RepID=A0A317EVB3_9SPHI|nr:hypothetical protein DF947_18500 [Pedobacter paludis]
MCDKKCQKLFQCLIHILEHQILVQHIWQCYQSIDYIMKTILIIDPNLNLLEVLCHALEMEKYEAIGYSGHELELIKLIQNIAPSLILINLTLPSDKSIEWCGRMKSLYPNLPIIAMSCDESILKKKNRWLFDGNIGKPFDLASFYNLIEAY